MEIKKFNPLNVSSKFAICGLPIRVDSYKTCSFGCKYCFAENRKIMEYEKKIQVANVGQVDKKLKKVLIDKNVDMTNFLEVLISEGVTWHWGGMSDPFQPCERKLGITKQLLDVTNKYGIHVLFSTKSNTTYDCDIKPELHSFQLSVSNVDNLKNIEPNVPTIESRYKFYRELKDKGFKVGIRIQPFIPNISTLEIVKMFHDADNFTLEGIKIVPQNEEHKNFVLNELGLEKSDFTQMGLLNLKPLQRLKLYKPFIDYFEKNNIPYSIADNDLHWIGTNKCCCGDRLVNKSTTFNNTYMIQTYGVDYAKEQLDDEIFESGVRDCKCNHLFTSNRQEGCISVQDFFDKRFYRKSSPFSPQFQFLGEENMATIYELQASYKIIQDAIEHGEDLTPILETLDAAIEEKADGYASVIANLTSDIEGIKAEEKRLKERRQSYEASINRLKENLFNCMKETGKTKFKTNLFSFSIAKNGGALPIVMKVDTSELPDHLVIIKEEPDKKAIAKYIEETGDVTFAEFGERGESLRIK